jgi:hypothetical protein
MYLIRIFADFSGRGLAMLPRIPCFLTINGVIIGCLIRCASSLIFFDIAKGVSKNPEYLHNTLEQSLILAVFQLFFSLFAGYFNCLIYEYACNSFSSDGQRLIAAQYLTLTFQKSCAIAVSFAIIVLMMIEYYNPCESAPDSERFFC